jgi:hypothetical protein
MDFSHIDIASIVAGFLGATVFNTKQIWAFVTNSVIPFLSNDKVKIAASTVARAFVTYKEFMPAYFNDPNVTWDDYLELIANKVINESDFTPEDFQAIVAEALKIWLSRK